MNNNNCEYFSALHVLIPLLHLLQAKEGGEEDLPLFAKQRGVGVSTFGDFYLVLFHMK